MAKQPVYHLNPPTLCDTCGTKIKGYFYDAITVHRVWANMCPSCFHLGPGLGRLGPGQGQQYERQADGRFMKVEAK